MFEKLFFNLLTLEKMTIVRLIKEQVFDFMKKRGIKNLFFLYVSHTKTYRSLLRLL